MLAAHRGYRNAQGDVREAMKECSRAVSPGCIRTERVDMIRDNKHQLSVYSVVSDESGRDLWVEIGYATPRPDGECFELTLRALPVGSRLVLREAASGDSRSELREDSQQQDSYEEPRDTCIPSLAGQVREFERGVIRQCLLETGGNIAAALQRLQIPRRTLNEKMVRLGIDRRGLRSSHRQRIAAKADDANQGPEAAAVPAE
jgi:transcriptional regulator with GAF, ATPase, and Fis domain